MNPLTRASLAFALLLGVSLAPAAEHPDRIVQSGVPQGKVTAGQFADSKIYPGTTRNYSVYVPAQYQPDEPAALMVFMDGGGYANPKGGFRVPVVFDNLIHKGEMPAVIGIFINPGVLPAASAPASDVSLCQTIVAVWPRMASTVYCASWSQLDPGKTTTATFTAAPRPRPR